MSSIPSATVFHRELHSFEIRIGQSVPLTVDTSPRQVAKSSEHGRAEATAATTESVWSALSGWMLAVFTMLFVIAVLAAITLFLFHMTAFAMQELGAAELHQFLSAFRGPG